MKNISKPIINKITPFDALQPYTVSIAWSGNRSYGTRIIIYDNATNNIVFDDTISTYSLKHEIPANTLTNGRSWVIQTQTFDEENTYSSLSDKVMFYTFSTPDFYFENIPEDSKISTASFSASIFYNSPDWEDLLSYKFYLYDSTKKKLLESNELTDDENISYSYRGLDNNTDYYIRCEGSTVNGMSLDTGYVLISVMYENPNTYARIYATTLPDQGCVQIATNLIIVQYNGTESFEYENGMIDLRDKTLYYDEGFLIEDDFTIIIRGINLWHNGDIFKAKNDSYGFTLSSHIYNEGLLRFRLTAPNGIGTYLIYSEPLVFEDQDMITIAIRRKNNIYQIKTFIELNYNAEGNMWYGTTRPSSSVEENDIWIDTDEISTYMVEQSIMQTFLDEDEPTTANVNDLWIGGD